MLSLGTIWVYSCLGWSFWIKVVFPLVIPSGIAVFCMHLFISVASLLCMEVKFYQNPFMPSRPGFFQFGFFLRVALRGPRRIFTLGLSSSIRNSVFMLFIPSAFLLCSFRSHILLQNNFPSLKSGC